MGGENCKTPYFVDINDDDELMPEALEVFHRTFMRLKEEGREDIASVRALTMTDKGDIAIVDKKKLYTNYFDERFLNVTCFNVAKVMEAHMFEVLDSYLRYDISYITESVFGEDCPAFIPHDIFRRYCGSCTLRRSLLPARRETINIGSLSMLTCYLFLRNTMII